MPPFLFGIQIVKRYTFSIAGNKMPVEAFVVIEIKLRFGQ